MPWSHPAYAQQAMQVSGYLSGRTPGDSPHVLAAFRRGLAEAGFAEGQNVAIEFRWAEARYDRLPAMAAELTRLPVSVIALSGGNPAIDAAKAASNTIPVVFVTGSDPLREGWVTSLNRPGGNVTGTTFMAAILGTKQLELLRMMIPTMTAVAILARSNSPYSQGQLDELQAAVRTLGLQSIVVSIATADEIDEAFTEGARRKADAFVVVGEPLFGEQSGRIATLAARHGMPGIFNIREFPAAGGLMVTARASPMLTANLETMSGASLRASGRPGYRCSSPPNSIWFSISELRRRLASQCPIPTWRSQTR